MWINFIIRPDWQFALIDNVEGVSLERIDPDRPTQDSMNWHSAASTVGFGTPTYRNSQYSIPETGNEITLSPQVFSPDGDGFNDVLSISYLFDQAGYTANIKIFDSQGVKQRTLCIMPCLRRPVRSPGMAFQRMAIRREWGRTLFLWNYLICPEP